MKTLITTCLALLVTPIWAQQANQPYASTRLKEWVSSFNDSDPSVFQTFVHQHYPSRVPIIAVDEVFRQQSGGFDLQSIDANSTATKASGIVRERASGAVGTIVVEVEAVEPFNMLSERILLGPRPTSAARLSLADLTQAIHTKVKSESTNGQFSGVVLAAKHSAPFIIEAGGFANRSTEAPNTLKTRFRVGSMDKMFTAVAVLQLVQAGRLHLTDTVGEVLTNYPNKEVASKVTVHHLLTHTGGTGDIFGPEFQARRQELRTISDYVRLYGTRSLAFAPGERFEYSNYGFNLLGAIIEKASGEEYDTYVQKHIFDPAHMGSTGFTPEDQIAPELSVGYMRRPPDMAWTPNTNTLPYRGTSAGGGYSTAEDLLRFATALQTGRLLTSTNVQLLTSPKVKTMDGHYGYGFDIRTINGIECFGHDGGAPGMSGELRICPAIDLTSITLENIDPPAATRMNDLIISRVPNN